MLGCFVKGDIAVDRSLALNEGWFAAVSDDRLCGLGRSEDSAVQDAIDAKYWFAADGKVLECDSEVAHAVLLLGDAPWCVKDGRVVIDGSQFDLDNEPRLGVKHIVRYLNECEVELCDNCCEDSKAVMQVESYCDGASMTLCTDCGKDDFLVLGDPCSRLEWVFGN